MNEKESLLPGFLLQIKLRQIPDERTNDAGYHKQLDKLAVLLPLLTQHKWVVVNCVYRAARKTALTSLLR